MPTYEYRCTECSHLFEEFQSISATPIKVCPECSGKTERLISGGAGFLFKGSGFYITENRSKDYQAASAKENSAPKSDSPKKDSKAKTDTSKKKDKSKN